MPHRRQGLDDREDCPVRRRNNCIQVAAQFVKGLKGLGKLRRGIRVDHDDGHELFVVVSEQVELWVFLHGLLHGNGRCVDVGEIGRIIEPDRELGLDQRVGFNVEACDDSCDTFQFYSRAGSKVTPTEIRSASFESAPEFSMTVGVGLDDGPICQHNLDFYEHQFCKFDV